MLRAAQPHANTILACMANLCTSAPGEQKHAWVTEKFVGLNVSGRIAEIEDLLYMDKIDSAGIQEGRLPSDGTVNGKRCVLYCAGGAGKKHHCGVLMWIAKEWAKAVQSVKVVSPRIIYVNVKLGDQLICAFSVHAPTEANWRPCTTILRSASKPRRPNARDGYLVTSTPAWLRRCGQCRPPRHRKGESRWIVPHN